MYSSISTSADSFLVDVSICKEISTDVFRCIKVRARMTIAQSNPIVDQLKRIVQQLTREMQLIPNAQYRQRKKKNQYYGRSLAR